MTTKMRMAAYGLLVAMLPVPAFAMPPGAATAAPQMMPEARFWSIVDSSRSDDQARQMALLKKKLAVLTPDELVAFQSCLDAQLQRSNRWDLWGAAYVALGGASDDGFEYFRLWLIARGRADFERVLADPDALAAIAPADPEQLEFEDFGQAAPQAWAVRTGKPGDAMPHLPADAAPVAGTKFSEDPAALAARYPRLWRRFGGDAR